MGMKGPLIDNTMSTPPTQEIVLAGFVEMGAVVKLGEAYRGYQFSHLGPTQRHARVAGKEILFPDTPEIKDWAPVRVIFTSGKKWRHCTIVPDGTGLKLIGVILY